MSHNDPDKGDESFGDEGSSRKESTNGSTSKSEEGKPGGKIFSTYSAFTRYQPLTNLQRGNVVQDKSAVTIERTIFELAAQGEIFSDQGVDLNQVNSDGLSLLHIAATHGQLLMVKYLLSRGLDTRRKTPQGHIPLHCASFYGHLHIVRELLLRDRESANERDNDGNTAIMYGCFGNNTLVVQELLRCGADVSTVNNSGETVFSIAIKIENRDILSILEKHILELVERQLPRQ